MKRTFLFFVFLFAALGAFAQVFTAYFDGFERTYKMYLPENLSQGAPLVFVLHGYST